MRIFVGSSSNYVKLSLEGDVDVEKTKTKTKLGRFVESLRRKGHKVEPWWEDETLQGGEHVLDNLIKKAKVCDGGVFLFGRDDKLTSKGRKKGDQKSVTRGNVLLECGMFLAAKGRENTFIIRDGPYSAVYWPSDILGIKLPDLSEKKLCKVMETFFKNSRNNRQQDACVFYFNKQTVESVFKRQYRDWTTKGGFIGAESARRWTEIERGNDYLLDTKSLSKFVAQIHGDKSVGINFKKIDNVISLGPGCGVYDDAVVSEIHSVNPTISYIPIDINPHLAHEAASYIGNKNPKIEIPFAIVDDFEANNAYVGEIIRKRITDLREVNLFMMLGGTFSNLEGTEHEIVQKFKAWMDSNDYLLMDVFIKRDDYSFARDKSVHVATMPDSYQKFLVNACIKKAMCVTNGEVSKAGQQFLKCVAHSLSSVLVAKEVKKAPKTRYTELESTVVTSYTLNAPPAWATMKKEVLIAKRYKYEEIEAFMERHFKVLHSYNGLKKGAKKGRGIFLLRRG